MTQRIHRHIDHKQNPSLRAKNSNLYTLAEKATLRHLVEVMLGCGISYVQIAQQHGWSLKAPYAPATMKHLLASAPGLSEAARKPITSAYFQRIVENRITERRPMDLGYVINRATSVDWNILDLFYQLCGFSHFRAMFQSPSRR